MGKLDFGVFLLWELTLSIIPGTGPPPSPRRVFDKKVVPSALAFKLRSSVSPTRSRPAGFEEWVFSICLIYEIWWENWIYLGFIFNWVFWIWRMGDKDWCFFLFSTFLLGRFLLFWIWSLGCSRGLERFKEIQGGEIEGGVESSALDWYHTSVCMRFEWHICNDCNLQQKTLRKVRTRGPCLQELGTASPRPAFYLDQARPAPLWYKKIWIRPEPLVPAPTRRFRTRLPTPNLNYPKVEVNRVLVRENG